MNWSHTEWHRRTTEKNSKPLIFQVSVTCWQVDYMSDFSLNWKIQSTQLFRMWPHSSNDKNSSWHFSQMQNQGIRIKTCAYMRIRTWIPDRSWCLGFCLNCIILMQKSYHITYASVRKLILVISGVVCFRKHT